MKWSAETCRARAEEAEALARIVAYEKDRERLKLEAQSWREHADRIEAHARQWGKLDHMDKL